MTKKQIVFNLGRTEFPVNIPEQAECLRMGKANPLTHPETAIRYALHNPIESLPLKELVKQKLAAKPDARAIIVISDNTRPVPYTGEAGILFPIVDEMIKAGLPVSNISLLVATGTHHVMTEDTLKSFLDPRIFALNIPIHNHDCRNQDDLKMIGKTEIGGDIKINRHYLESDLKILTGLVESHFMAGVSGGRKSICPGLLAEDSIYILHGGSILSSAYATDLLLENNPVHEEALHVAKMAGCDMIVNVTLDSDYRLTGVFAGNMERAHIKAVEALKTYAAIPVDRKYDLVITHAGFVGINHYQAAKGGLVCAALIEPQGFCVLAASHPDTDPIGSQNYKDMMKLLGELGWKKYLATIMDPDWVFVPDQWEAQMWARLFKNIPPEHLFYNTLDISPSDFEWLPGTDARTLSPSAMSIEALVEASIAEATQRLTKTLQRQPSVAVLQDGPYGIPLFY